MDSRLRGNDKKGVMALQRCVSLNASLKTTIQQCSEEMQNAMPIAECGLEIADL
jgi:hypothetical protein